MFASLLGACGDAAAPSAGREPIPTTPVPATDWTPPAPPSVPRGPARHAVVLWTFGDDAAREGLAERVRELGAEGIQVPPDGDAAVLAGIRSAGLSWYADHAAGKGVLGLRETLWRPAWDAAWAARETAWPAESVRRRPVCLHDPAELARLEERTRASALRAAGRTASGAAPAAAPALWISLEDEPSATVRANPLDWCLCEPCCAAFREFVRGRFRDVAALNEAWGTSFPSFDDVQPETTAAVRARVLREDPSSWNLAPWCAVREFQDARFAAIVARLAAVARDAAPGVPVGLTGLQAPSAFGGWDLALLLRDATFAVPYDAGLATAIARDLLPPGATLARTLFPSEDPRVPVWQLWRGVARGANATILWSSKDVRTEHGLAPWAQRVAVHLQVLTREDGPGPALARAHPLDEGVVVLLSQPSVRVRWMLDSVEDGATWMRRFGSHEAAHSSAIRSRETAWRALSDRGRRFADARDVAAGRVPRPRLLVLPDPLAVPEDLRARIAAWAAEGTVVVADGPSPYDGDGRALPESRARLPGTRIDPGFADLRRIAADVLGPEPLRVEATLRRADGSAGDRIPMECGLHAAGRTRIAVCVPAYADVTSDGGSGEVTIPQGVIDVSLRFPDGRARTVRDGATGVVLGTLASLHVVREAGDPVVLVWDE